MLQTDWLGYRRLSAISVQRLEVTFKKVTFSRFSEVLSEDFEVLLDKNEIHRYSTL